MLRINQIKIPVCPEEHKIHNIKNKVSKIIKSNDFSIVKIVKESIDARDKSNLLYIYSVDLDVPNETSILKKFHNNKNILKTSEQSYSFPHILKREDSDKILNQPVIIGAGPAGYFCALQLARAGYKPIIIERGCPVEKRTLDVENFWKAGVLNPESNVSFGEGGAGTFSDGKLTTGIKDKFHRIDQVLSDLIKFGAKEDIAYVNKPHIGTDVLKKIMINMRTEITRLGGTILFESLLTDIEIIEKNNKKEISNVVINISKNSNAENILSNVSNKYTLFEKDGKKYAKLSTNALILAIGHSARDTFIMLNDNSIPMEAKPFAIGLRIEHKAAAIDESQYGNSENAKYLPTSSYKMTYRSSEGRSVYSFCMCPGGYVVNASSGDNQSVVNGMSYSDRAGDNSNSAIVVNVTPEDFEAEGFDKYGVLSGMYFQIHYENKAYIEGKKAIPVQCFADYKEKKITTNLGRIKPNIKGKYSFGDLNNCLPAYVNNAIIEGVEYYNTKVSGFSCNDAVLSGIESRTSSPVRIIRDEENMSEIKGLFPCGEGAGYAGGITSAAVDGIKIAESCAKLLCNMNNI